MLAQNRGIYTVALCNLIKDIADKNALHSGIALRADFLLICENGKYGLLCIRFESCGNFGISANSVVVTVACHKRAVETDVLRLYCGNSLKLRA